MVKRSASPSFILSAFGLATVWLFAAVLTAQKSPGAAAGAPIRGADVKLGKNPGGGASTRTTDADGNINLKDLTPGNYWLELVPPPAPAKGATTGDDYGYVAVTISGARLTGGAMTRSLDVRRWQFVEPRKTDETARATAPPTADTYSNRISFTVGRTPAGVVEPPVPLQATVVKSKSNICNN